MIMFILYFLVEVCSGLIVILLWVFGKDNKLILIFFFVNNFCNLWELF